MTRESAICETRDRQCRFDVEMSDERTIVFVKRAHIEHGDEGAFCTYAIGDHGMYYYDREGGFVRYAAGE
jgi:hypothetical protein